MANFDTLEYWCYQGYIEVSSTNYEFIVYLDSEMNKIYCFREHTISRSQISGGVWKAERSRNKDWRIRKEDLNSLLMQNGWEPYAVSANSAGSDGFSFATRFYKRQNNS